MTPLKYNWQRGLSRGQDRFDLVLGGSPDCFAYIIRYQNKKWGAVWCWILTMPRGGREVAHGFARASYIAKREVEAAIAEHWNQ
jgi:hypothetical protein